MSTSSNYLAIDLGASSGRAVLARFDGRRLQTHEVHRFANGPVRVLGTLRWDVGLLLREVKAALAKCRSLSDQPESVGIDTWGVDFGLIDAGGELLGWPYHYRDARTRGMIEWAAQKISRRELYELTGIQFMELNTLYQLLATAQNSPALLAPADRLLFMPDLLNYWLTGERFSEYTIASTSQMLSAGSRVWNQRVLKVFDLPDGLLPEVRPPASRVGEMHGDVADEVGLAATVVAPAGHDTACAVAAVPHVGADQDWAYISCGTWSLVGVEVDRPILSEEAMRWGFTNEGGAGDRILLLSNLAGLWLLQECRREWSRRGDDYSYGQLAQLAAAASPGGALIDPDDPVFAAPGNMPERIVRWCAEHGQRVPDGAGQVVRCTLESLALKHDQVLRRVERLTGRKIAKVYMVGGGARNELLCQLTADACGRYVVAGPAEATAIGNALLQAMALGHVGSLQELRTVVRDSATLRTYEPTGGELWNALRERFDDLSGG